MTDGKIGDLVQCRGIARHFKTDTLTERVVAPRGLWAWPLPFIPVAPSQRPERDGSPIAPPYPQLVIASGRRTLPYLRAIKSASPETAIVYLKDPRGFGRGAADFIWAPVHDGLKAGATFIATHTSPHGLTQDRLEKAKGAPPFDKPQSNLIGIVLGGDSGAVKWNATEAETFASLVAAACSGSNVTITPSRRTPSILKDAVCAALPNAFFDEDGSLYLALLANSAKLIVTGDSHNMVSEALATGAPVHVYRPNGLQPKLHNFLDAMVEAGAIRDLAAPMIDFTGMRLDATEEIAAAISRHLGH